MHWLKYHTAAIDRGCDDDDNKLIHTYHTHTALWQKHTSHLDCVPYGFNLRPGHSDYWPCLNDHQLMVGQVSLANTMMETQIQTCSNLQPVQNVETHSMPIIPSNKISHADSVFHMDLFWSFPGMATFHFFFFPLLETSYWTLPAFLDGGVTGTV